MKKLLVPVFAAFFFAAVLGQGFHRHARHDGGFFGPHVDCTLCAWSSGLHVPAAGPAAAPFAARAVARARLAGASASASFSQTVSSLSRAPPLS